MTEQNNSVNEIRELINLLQAAAVLQLERDTTELELEEVEQLRAAAEERRVTAERAELTALRREVQALNREKDALEAEIQLLKRKKEALVSAPVYGSSRKSGPKLNFSVGEKVCTKRDRKYKFRSRTVTRVCADKIGQTKVWFKGEEGVETWRAPSNLRKHNENHDSTA